MNGAQPFEPRPDVGSPSDVTIRFAYKDDAAALRGLRELLPESLPGGPMLVAEVLGEIRVAVDIRSCAALVDPRHPSTALVTLLRQRAGQLKGVPMPTEVAERLAVPDFPRPAPFNGPRPRVRLR